jgi:hypothetical protein
MGVGCPVCFGRVATPTTSLAALHPELRKEWHPEKDETVAKKLGSS